MLNSAIKQFILPFSPNKNKESSALQVEAAAIYAVAEFERMKGGGLIQKQPEEKICFIAEIGYPIWLYPKDSSTYLFDGLNNFNYSILYVELPDATSFLEDLEAKSRTLEDYMNFLTSSSSFFLHSTKEKQFSFRSLIDDSEFKKEFNDYLTEAKEITSLQSEVDLLTPNLQETTISSMLSEMTGLRSSLKENGDRVPECLSAINKTTSQFKTEIDYAAQAVKDETAAKIKAQEELINPQISKLNREYKKQKSNVTVGFDKEIDKLEKLKTKKSRLIVSKERKIDQYEKAAQKQSQKNHVIYEKRWKTKSKESKNEIDELKKEIKNIENSIRHLVKQKNDKIFSLQFELESKVKLTRQPLLDLEAARDAKTSFFEQRTENLLNQEKTLITALNDELKMAERVNYGFQMLGGGTPQLNNPALFYVPFYVACYQSVSTRRYLCFAPSTINSVGFSAKLKGAMGFSKIKEMFTTRFKSIEILIEKVQTLSKQDSLLEQKIIAIGERNNLLKNEASRTRIVAGLVNMKDADWLSQREYQSLTNSLAQS